MESIKEKMKYLNKDSTIGILFIDKKFEPNNFLGEKFTKIRKKGYTKRKSGEEVLENPNAKETSYSKELIEKAKKIIGLMDYSDIKLWTPSTDSPMIISYDSDKSIIIIGERVKNK